MTKKVFGVVNAESFYVGSKFNFFHIIKLGYDMSDNEFDFCKKN